MTPTELARLRKIAEAATPGPWEESSYRVMTVGPKDLGVVAYLANNKATRTVQASKNTSFIASLNPQTVLQLIEMCESAVEMAGYYGDKRNWESRYDGIDMHGNIQDVHPILNDVGEQARDFLSKYGGKDEFGILSSIRQWGCGL